MTECARARRAAFAFAMAVTAGLGVDFAWAVDPPPRPSLTVGSSSVQADLESWCRPVGERFACTFVSPTANHRFPAVSGPTRALMMLDTSVSAVA